MEPTKKSRQRACNACTKAKKRCDQQYPSCRRCVLRDIECYYPSTRLHENNDTPTAPTSVTSSRRRISRPQHDVSEALISVDDSMQFLPQSDDLSLIYSNNPLSLFQMNHNYYNPGDGDGGGSMGFTEFFLLPDSWTILDSDNKRNCDLRPVHQLNKTVHQVQAWMKQWVEEGSNMFIHRRLYFRDDEDRHSSGAGGCFNMPRCIQDAYTTCATYFSCTPKNRKMVLSIVEQRVETLLEEERDQNQDFGGDDNNNGHEQVEYLQFEEVSSFRDSALQSQTGNDTYDGKRNETRKHSVLDHLARVQALMVYQFIRLYDGDLQSRVMAESLMPVLSRWCMQMLDSALLSSEYVHSVSTMNLAAKGQASIEKKLNSDWNAWILAESVRRTWLVAGHVQSIYRLLNYGISPCPGGLRFTTRAGLWHAESAYEFGTRCREKDVLFYRSSDSGRQLLRTRPEEVDDFGRYVLQVVEGEEKVKQWFSIH